MSVDAKHPDWADRILEWRTMRHAARGMSAVKAQGEAYLPKPDGFRSQADGGLAMYMAYQTRAQFPEILTPTLRGMLGVIHRAEAQITLPSQLETLWERATPDGLPLESFHRRITAELLLQGRYAVLVDAASTGSDVPYLVGYQAEALINWTDERDLFVLGESGRERTDFVWKHQERYRVLKFEDGVYGVDVYKGHDQEGDTIKPTGRAKSELPHIPFVVIGATDLAVEPDDCPLFGVANSALAIYRLDADYRYQLFMTGQETLVVSGVAKENVPNVIGASVVIALPDPGSKAEYIGPKGTGIAAHRQAILDERDAAVAHGAALFGDNTNRAQESGDARRLRYAAQTATLTSIALSSAAGLERALRDAALFVGANPDEVVVKPNLKFMESRLSPREIAELVKAWQGGAYSYETLYENLQRGEVASAERTADEERALIETENPLDPPSPHDHEDLAA